MLTHEAYLTQGREILRFTQNYNNVSCYVTMLKMEIPKHQVNTLRVDYDL